MIIVLMGLLLVLGIFSARTLATRLVDHHDHTGWMHQVVLFYGSFLMFPFAALGGSAGFRGPMLLGLIPWVGTIALGLLGFRGLRDFLHRRGSQRYLTMLAPTILVFVLLSAGAAISCLLMAVLFGN